VFALPEPPLTSALDSTAQYTFYFGGTVNAAPFIIKPDGDEEISPYTNNSTLEIRTGATLKITGNLTSYTQQVQQFRRVIGETLPSLNTVVNGTLDVSRVNIVNGTLAGTGTITGPISLFTSLGAINGSNGIPGLQATPGGFLLPASSANISDGSPGILGTG